MVCGLPSYVFFLLCCYKENCPHPQCQAGPPSITPTWYPGGPPISHLPLPVPDPERPWGNNTCSSCVAPCSGHYKTILVDVRDSLALSNVPRPPSAVLKRLFSSSNGVISDTMMDSASKEVLLPCEECQIWLSHLQTVMENRRRGAKKAAATRKAKLQTRENCSGSRKVHESGFSPQQTPLADELCQSQVGVNIILTFS